jgi:putative aminopeptidase FrvX
LDNRIGGFMIAEVARMLKKGKSCLTNFIIAVQEEIGLRGAQMVAQNIKPNVAILLMFVTKHPLLVILSKEGEHIAGAGGVVTRAPAVHNKLRK